MSLKPFSREFCERSLDLLWSHWSALGVAATHSTRSPSLDNSALDPEALLLMTTTVGRWDARLFDEVLDWCQASKSLLNFPRAKALHRKFGLGDRDVLFAIADRIGWKVDSPKKSSRQEPLFRQLGKNQLPSAFGPIDEGFRARGFLRGKISTRQLSNPNSIGQPLTAHLSLRALFGVNARAEIILWLLTHDFGHPSQIARETGYSQKNIQDTLVVMTESPLVSMGPPRGRTRPYSIDHGHWKAFLWKGASKLNWRLWPARYRNIEIAFEQLTRTPDFEALEPILQLSEFHRIVENLLPDENGTLIDPEIGVGSDQPERTLKAARLALASLIPGWSA